MRKLEGGQMRQTKINKREIKEYLFPELENIKALLEGLHLIESLFALIFFEKIVENELKKYEK